ncbi:MAG: hypothetical protein HY000_28540 [Planctomycetes bacterium]|nr:hypothetical protein [Planctomycetota bacterium]
MDELVEKRAKFLADLQHRLEDVLRDSNRSLFTRTMSHYAAGAVLGSRWLDHGISNYFKTTATNTLRLGDSLLHPARVGDPASRAESNAAAFEDLMRVLNILPIFEIGTGMASAAQASRSARVLQVLQRGSTMECTPVAIAKASMQTGHVYLMDVPQFAKESGVALQDMRTLGTDAERWGYYLDALRKMKVPYQEVMPTSTQLTFLEDLVKAHPRGTLVIHIETQQAAHTLIAQTGREGKVIFFDTTNHVYTGVQELARAYPGYTVSRAADFKCLFVPNTMYVNIENVAASAHGLLVNLFFPLVPKAVMGGATRAAP